MITPRPPRFGNYRRSANRRTQDQDILEVRLRTRVVTQQRNRRLLSLGVKLLLILGIAGGAVYGVREGLRRFLWENPEYRLAVVEIQNDGASLTREMIIGTAGLELGTNVFRINLKKARTAIAEIPQVESVDVTRVLPNKIAISLSERRPVAWIADREDPDATASERSFLVDGRGIVFRPKRQVPEYLRLPVIYGIQPENYLPGDQIEMPELTAALELISLNSAFNRFHFRSIDLSKGYCMEVIDARRAKVTFGFDRVAQQLDRLNAIYDYLASSRQEIQMVNLMVERNIPVRLGTPPTEEELLAEAARGADKEERAAAESEAAAGAASATSATPKAPGAETAAAPASTPPAPAAAATPAPARVASSSSGSSHRESAKKSSSRSRSSSASSSSRTRSTRKTAERERPSRPTVRKAKPAATPEVRRALPVEARRTPSESSTPATRRV